MTGPEEKAANRLADLLDPNDCCDCDTCALLAIRHSITGLESCAEGMVKTIARANAEYYLPLLRDLYAQVIEMKEAGYHAPELYEIIDKTSAEIARLEEATK